MSKRNPEDILKQLDKPTSAWGRSGNAGGGDEGSGDEDMDRVLAMTDAEVQAELEAQGVDLAAVDAKAEAMAEGKPPEPALESPEPAKPLESPARLAPVVPLRPRPRRWMKWAPVAIAAGAGGAIGLGQVIELLAPVTLVATGRDAAAEPENARAAHALREEARVACDGKEWSRCLSLLDRAAKLDPEGDREAEARRLRRVAKEGVSEAGGTP